MMNYVIFISVPVLVKMFFLSGQMFYSLIFFSLFLLILLLNNLTEEYFLDSYFYYDGVGVILVGLSVWVSILMLYSSYKISRFKEFNVVFSFLVVSLMMVLCVSFFCGSFLMFYFFFEISLVPTLLIIMGWGYQPERLQAGVYFLFYTLTASLPLLLFIIYMYVKEGSLSFCLNFFIYGGSVHSISSFFLMGLMGIMAFMVKLPMYFTHLWLPKAHVEAPVAGSMVLAGVLLKLGGYGLMRLVCLSGGFLMFFSPYIMGLSLVGMAYVGFMCCRSNDFKALVAYSSVAHMAMVVGGILTLYTWGFLGGVVMMVAHGLSSSGLFCIVNMYYERTGSRSFFINKGLILSLPSLTLFMFLLCAANIAAPPTINLLSEIFLMTSIMSFDYLMFLVFPLGTFLGAVFTLFMYSFSQHGGMFFSSFSFSSSNFRELHVLFLHVLPVNLMILNSSILLSI